MMNKVDPTTTFDSSYEFIELHRTFYELPKNSSENDDLDISRAFRRGDRRWSDLINEYRIIILSEAGSGKTAEIRSVAYRLREQQKSAFFLRLENVAGDFEDAFEVGTYEAFKEWLASDQEGWLLLDSVDESRLRDPRDFERAIRKMSRLIDTAKDRTHIVITSRAPAWRPKTDLAYCNDHLPFTVATTLECDPQAENDDPEGSIQIKTVIQEKERLGFKIFALDDLTSDQIAIYAKARGIEEYKDFLDAVERADAWSFTSRPQDLEELTEFWIDKGKIGTRLEIMRNSIDRRLTERDQDRAEARPLSFKRARQGAMLLAAATTLTQNQTIRVPNGADNSIGIAVQFLLSDWDENEHITLLSRPIFDEAIYGTVRFHHRSVREYLTAEWFAELLKHKTSRRTIEGLFFRNQYGLDIVVPTLRPILPWLVILDEKIRERVRKIAPEIIFEGGDPSSLPLEIRRYILKEACAKIAKGDADRSMLNYAAIQRFANPDLTKEICESIQQYRDNTHLTAFLLRMVCLGQITLALPETMKIALTPNADKHVRIAAFVAIKEIGSGNDQEQVRQSFSAETSELNRECFAELLDGIEPTEKILNWLLLCLEKSETYNRYSVDRLAKRVTEFADIADIELLPQLIIGLNRLLNIPPTIDRTYCEVSKKFQWLMAPAAKAVERAILNRHPISLEIESLAILHKLSNVRGYEIDDVANIRDDFLKLVPAWQELNRNLFWFEVQKSRKSFDEKLKQRLINFRQASIFGSFWQFEGADFEYVAEEISLQLFLDNKLVALSLAFNLYMAANRPPALLMQLEQLAAKNDLSEWLSNYLRPPQDESSRLWEQQNIERERLYESEQKKQEKDNEDWKKYISDNLDEARSALQDNPGAITQPLHILFQKIRDKNRTTGKWTEYGWKILIPEYGEDIARFYRNGTVSFWRNHKPKLRSEGAPFNRIPSTIIIGLTGLEIEANETNGWPTHLSAAEVELACKYASFEMNGFPTWFPKLFETHSELVCKFLIREIRYELSIEKSDVNTHYLISDVSHSGQWAWEQIAPSIVEILKKEPKNLSNLDQLLKILTGVTLSNELIAKLASQKCNRIKKLDHLARWFAIWIRVNPKAALASFQVRISKIAKSKEQTKFAMTFITHIWNNRSEIQAFLTPDYLKSLYLLMHEYIRKEEDINRADMGVYTPELRDNAQEARDRLLHLLKEIPGEESFLALTDIAARHPSETSRPWILLHAKTRAEQDGDIKPWLPEEVKKFQDSPEHTPDNHDNSVKKILILAANPINLVRLSLEREVEEIRTTLQLSANRDRFTIETRGAVRPDDLQKYMYDIQPQIVHFSGHGIGRGADSDNLPSSRKFTVIADDNKAQPEGLMFEDDKGRAKLVSGKALANLCALFSKKVECVVLNACYSAQQAEEIAKYIPYVIGMSQAIGDIAARKFSQGFYRAIWNDRSIEEAFASGKNAIELEGISEELTPVLLKKSQDKVH
jgi:CHAT domain